MHFDGGQFRGDYPVRIFMKCIPNYQTTFQYRALCGNITIKRQIGDRTTKPEKVLRNWIHGLRMRLAYRAQPEEFHFSDCQWTKLCTELILPNTLFRPGCSHILDGIHYSSSFPLSCEYFMQIFINFLEMRPWLSAGLIEISVDLILICEWRIRDDPWIDWLRR